MKKVSEIINSELTELEFNKEMMVRRLRFIKYLIWVYTDTSTLINPNDAWGEFNRVQDNLELKDGSRL
jgi:hypothetical protein